MATIIDVAKKAGVSRSTVSRVISEKGVVNDFTREKVEKAIRELKYTPNFFAQGIRTGKTKMIAVLIPDHKNPFYGEMFTGIEEVALKNGYMVMSCGTDMCSEREIEYIKELVKRQVDGIICNIYRNSKENEKYLFDLATKMPLVFMDHHDFTDDCQSYVLVDGYLGSKNAVEYLLRKGKRRIGYIKMSAAFNLLNHRFEGYKKGLLDAGIEIDESLVFDCPEELSTMSQIEIGKRGAEYLMRADNPPDAIMCVVDSIAIGVIQFLKKAGYSIPQDVGVVGFDNVEVASIIEPNLTTIVQPTQKMGEKAAEIIIKKINGETNYNHRIEFIPELKIREST